MSQEFEKGKTQDHDFQKALKRKVKRKSKRRYSESLMNQSPSAVTNDDCVIVMDLEDDDDELMFLIDYLNFGRLARFHSALPILRAYLKETDENMKRLHTLNILFQLMLQLEDTIMFYIAMRERHLNSTRLVETLSERKISKGCKEWNDTIESISTHNIISDIGLTRYRRMFLTKHGITTTYLNKRMKDIRKGLARIIEVHKLHERNYNKIKHGMSIISSCKAFNMDIKDFNQTILTLQTRTLSESKKVCGCILITPNDDTAKAMVKNIALCSDVLGEAIILFSLFKYTDKKDILRKALVIQPNLSNVCVMKFNDVVREQQL